MGVIAVWAIRPKIWLTGKNWWLERVSAKQQQDAGGLKYGINRNFNDYSHNLVSRKELGFGARFDEAAEGHKSKPLKNMGTVTKVSKQKNGSWE